MTVSPTWLLRYGAELYSQHGASGSRAGVERAKPGGGFWSQAHSAVGETVILLHPPLFSRCGWCQ